MSLEKALESLQSQIGKEAHCGDWLLVSQARINQFAEATDDHQWIPVDPEATKLRSPLGSTIAHGFLTLSMIVPLTRQDADETAKFTDFKMAINYGLNKVRFPAPVKAGARIRARTVLKAIAAVNNSLQLTRSVTIDIENSEKPACVAETLSRLYFE